MATPITKYRVTVEELDDEGNTNRRTTTITVEANDRSRYECIAEAIQRISKAETYRMLTEEFTSCMLSKQDYEKLCQNIQKRLIGVTNESS